MKYNGGITGRYAFIFAVSIADVIVNNGQAARAHNYTGQCTVNFDNTFALSTTYTNARGTITQRTAFNSSGALDSCEHLGNPPGCWMYRHRCATNYVNVDDPTTTMHYHLTFTDPAFSGCGFADPGDGYGSGFTKNVGGSCVIPNWTTEPRRLWVHNSITIQMHPAGSMTTKTVFDLARLNIGGPESSGNVQVWFHSTLDGNWYGWPSMAPNNWNTLASAHDIDEVSIFHVNYGQNFEIEDFDILD